MFAKNSTASQSELTALIRSEANDLLSSNYANVYLVFEALGDSSRDVPHPLVSRFVATAMELVKNSETKSAEGQ